MVRAAYLLAFGLLLGTVAEASPAPVRYSATSCEHVTPGVLMYHARLAAPFRVAAVDTRWRRAVGTFPGTHHATAQVPVRCADLVLLEDAASARAKR